MIIASREGFAPFGEFKTWHRVLGELGGGSPADPAPLVLLHGGPGATHDYLSPLEGLARAGPAVVFYDQFGNGRSSHLPIGVRTSGRSGSSSKSWPACCSISGSPTATTFWDRPEAASWPRSMPSPSPGD